MCATVIKPPRNGTMGDCLSTLEDRHHCTPDCDRGFVRSGEVRCNGGSLENTATCTPCSQSKPNTPGYCAHGGTCVESGTECNCTSGWVLMWQNAPICWGSRKQKCVALSSCEAEIVALSEAAKDVVFFRKLVSGIDRSAVDGPTDLYTDSKSGRDLSYNPEQHQKTKQLPEPSHMQQWLATSGHGPGNPSTSFRAFF